MKIFNTLSRRKEEFIPLEPGKVRMYVCGPTVYDFIHIGNTRPMIFFDSVRRYLEYKGYEVNYVSNFTDVDDKIIKRALADGVEASVISERFTEKKFTLPIHVIGAPEGYTIRLFPQDVEVSVRVGISHFGNVQAQQIRAVCTYTPERKDKLNVELQYTNPYITAAWSYPGIVEFLLIEK